ncbi:MAG: hypothetical protein ACREL9_07345 [Gemmatimonadales bacterium]
MPRRFVDLSHEIEHGMVTYRGLPPPVIGDWLDRKAYIDASFHRYADGPDVAAFALEAVADLEALVVRPAHTLLLGAGIPIVEHLTNLGALPDRGCRFFAVPVTVKGMGSFPVRAFGLIDG